MSSKWAQGDGPIGVRGGLPVSVYRRFRRERFAFPFQLLDTPHGYHRRGPVDENWESDGSRGRERPSVWVRSQGGSAPAKRHHLRQHGCALRVSDITAMARLKCRSEEHTSELQSQSNIVCRLLLEKKKDATGIQVRGTGHGNRGVGNLVRLAHADGLRQVEAAGGTPTADNTVSHLDSCTLGARVGI